MDIESIRVDNKVKPYLINSYDGRHYLTSYNHNEKELFREFLTKLINQIQQTSPTHSVSSPSNKIFVYAHNLSTFDGVLMLKHLFQFGRVEPLIYNGKLISIKLIVNKTTIIFKDSMLLLPSSLSELCKSFNLEQNKGLFPFNLMDIYYTGSFPRFEYWTDIGFFEHEDMAKAFKGIWSFKDEAIKYCKLDCLVLYQILTKFNDLIFNKWNINIHSPLTLPSLAFKIYKALYMPKNTVYQLLGPIESDIRESYTGGAVDVYIPHNRTSPLNKRPLYQLVYSYDVNSLYPYVMANFDMPIGKPIVFEGDIRQVEPEAFGFFYCKISSPEYLEHPILQRRIKTSNGMRTVAGLGTWEGWIYSEEMDNALKYGYTFEIYKGYEYEKGDIFSSYINKMYSLRMKYPKGDAMNLIAKLLMNSLYGKFGMKLQRKEVSIFNCSTEEGMNDFKEMLNIFGKTIEDYVKIGDKFLIIRESFADIKYNEELDMFHGQNINVAIASAITAGGRVEMSIFKNKPNFNLYYCDTDSGITDKPLADSLIGTGLGKLKLEHTINRAVFLAPKVYGFIDTDGREIIKIKGIKSDVVTQLSIQDIELLLIKDSERVFTQEKWFKNILAGEISLADMAYTLKVTANKRQPLYINQDGLEIYNSTKPFKFDDISSIK